MQKEKKNDIIFLLFQKTQMCFSDTIILSHLEVYHVHDVIHLLYYEYWKDKQKYFTCFNEPDIVKAHFVMKILTTNSIRLVQRIPK